MITRLMREARGPDRAEELLPGWNPERWTLREALRVALTEDIAQMSDDPKWQPPADDDHPQDSDAIRDLTAIDLTASNKGAEL